MSAIPEEIERVAALGWVVYPMSRASKAGAFKGAAAAATSDLEQIETWCRLYPNCGWRVVCGPSGLFGLDIDRAGETHQADGFAAMAELTERYGPLPPRPMTRTGGSGGAALFFRHQGERLRGESGQPRPGLDPHRGRQAIVIPPSRHAVSGGFYTWRIPPWEVAPPHIPTWLATLLAPPPEPKVATQPFLPTSARAREALVKAMMKVMDAPPGVANVTLNKQSYRIGTFCGAGLIGEREAEQAMCDAASRRRVPDNEAMATIRSGLSAGMRNPIQARHVG